MQVSAAACQAGLLNWAMSEGAGSRFVTSSLALRGSLAWRLGAFAPAHISVETGTP